MGKKLLIISATAREISLFIDQARKEEFSNYTFDILIAGIGLTATSYHLSRQLCLKKYDGVIQAGVAGSFDKKLSPGSVVAVKQDTIADESVEELKQLKTLFDLKLVPQHKYPYKNGWLVNPYHGLLKKTGLKQVKAVSVNQISTGKKKINWYRQKFNPAIESMEGAALHYVCMMEKTPFLQIRSISNYIGERNKKKWNLDESILNLNDCLVRIIKNY
jgi:futalosine hydrolase